MLNCAQPHHVGNRQVTRIVTFIRAGKTHEGCRSCIEPMLTDQFPAQKRLVISQGSGKHYYISAAHKRDIRMRRVAPDLSGVWKDRRGVGGGMRY